MKKLWFKAKSHGWGWTPATWEGWAVTLVYVALLAWSIGRFTNYVVEHSGEPVSSLLFPIAGHIVWVSALIGSLSYITVKTGERPEWRWGE